MMRAAFKNGHISETELNNFLNLLAAHDLRLTRLSVLTNS